ncbi:MAG TPA: TonB-dependent receptor [Gammaproteobacteria bacterium]|nr:TonB-dependent receptor [Gammaproteobacteria bacterium]
MSSIAKGTVASKAPVLTKVLSVAALTAIGVGAAEIQAPAAAQDDGSSAAGAIEEVTVSARRRDEAAQDVPIPVSVVSGQLITDVGAFNVNRIKELVPTVQLYSSNPRNTAVNIRGLGTTFGLTNDGIEGGVGFYVDGVYYARPAATSLDFIDVERLEVLRGPQGTLFGKNTTAGAILVTTRKPTFSPEGMFELGYGNEDFVQAKGSFSGPLGEKLAGRVSFSSTQRDGQIYNVRTNEWINTLDNQGVRAQLLLDPSDRVEVTAAIDYTRQNPNGYAQVLAGIAPTLRPAYRQFDAISTDLGYTPVSLNPFARITDTDAPWRSQQDLGGVSLNVDVSLSKGKLTSTTAWRYWTWDPSNDRDFIGLPVLELSQGTSRQDQWSQEVRWTGDFSRRLSGVFGFFAFGQTIQSDPVQKEEAGAAQWRFSQSSLSPLWQTPGLLDGYGIATTVVTHNTSEALFGQLDWAITDRLSLLPGLRINFDKKDVDYDRATYGGLQTTDPALLALKLQVYSPQAFKANVADANTSGNLTLRFEANPKINAYATYSTGFKPVGMNVGGLPTDAAGNPILASAVVKPEHVTNVELGVKTTPTPRSTADFAFYDTEVKDYQTQVQNAQLGVNRGYLANADKVRVRGAEFDGNVSIGRHFVLRGALAYTDGVYESFPDAPVPLEETGGAASSKDISGQVLPGISKWGASFGGEVTAPLRALGGGEIFGGLDIYHRSEFSSSPTPSKYLWIDGYSTVNARVGFRASKWSAYLWARNLLDENYLEQLLVAGGNAGQYAAVLGDPRTYGVTVRYTLE